MTASCVLASLNASTYWKVRLGISLAAALLDGHFEQPAGMKQALPFPSSFFQMLMIPHRSRECQVQPIWMAEDSCLITWDER
jgi:hypothetical protein